MIWHFWRQNRLGGETFGVKSTLCEPDRDHPENTHKKICVLFDVVFSRKKGDTHRFAGINLSCEFRKTFARLDKMMRARRLALTDWCSRNRNELKRNSNFGCAVVCDFAFLVNSCFDVLDVLAYRVCIIKNLNNIYIYYMCVYTCV